MRTSIIAAAHAAAVIIIAIIFVLWVSPDEATPTTPETTPMQAPQAAQIPHQYSHHGITVEDPFAWLKDQSYPVVDDAEVLAYLEEENAYYDQFMTRLNPLVETLFEEIKGRQPTEDESVPYAKNGWIYQWRFNKDAQYRTWYRASETSPDNWQVLLDERELAEGHEYFRLGGLSVSPDASRLAYSSDTSGGER